MKASELSAQAKAHAYGEYCAAMDDDLNRADTLSVDEWEAQADWMDFEYDEHGNVIE
jgi:hypothetical protein